MEGNVMERLTKRGTDGQAMMDCEKCKADWTGKHGKPMADCTALYCRNRLKDRLAAYEDRECAPEEVLPKEKADEIALKLMRLADLESLCSYTRLRELAEADKDGRLVVLPCKVGDTVYRLFAGNPDNPVIATLKINTVAEAVKLIGKMGMHKYIGTFLTREEAEKALEAMK
jgi:hypothetical protein